MAVSYRCFLRHNVEDYQLRLAEVGIKELLKQQHLAVVEGWVDSFSIWWIRSCG